MMPRIDPTWRYHWLLHSDRNIKPDDFPDFATVMDSWGEQAFKTTVTASQMLAIGLDLQPHQISQTFINGSNYLSPPAVDLTKNKINDIITGFHRDFGILTAYAPCRFSGLSAWLLTGEKV